MKTVTLDKYLTRPIIQQDGSIFCRRCNRRLGEIDPDGQYLQAGNILLFGRWQKYFCVCGKAYNFSERDLAGGHKTSDFPQATHEILNELGKDYLITQEQRDYHKSKKQNPDDDGENKCSSVSEK